MTILAHVSLTIGNSVHKHNYKPHNWQLCCSRVHNSVPSPPRVFTFPSTFNHFSPQSSLFGQSLSCQWCDMIPFCFDHLIARSWFYDVITWSRWPCDNMWSKLWRLTTTHFVRTWPGQVVKAVFLRCPRWWPLVASSSSPSGWRALRQAPPTGNPETSAFHLQGGQIGKTLNFLEASSTLPTLCDHARAWLVNTDWAGARARWLI